MWKDNIFVILTVMMYLSIIQVIILSIRINRAKKLGRSDSKAEWWFNNVVIWKFALVMVVKVIYELHIDMPKNMPILWIVDAIIMNAVVAQLVAKNICNRLKK